MALKSHEIVLNSIICALTPRISITEYSGMHAPQVHVTSLWRCFDFPCGVPIYFSTTSGVLHRTYWRPTLSAIDITLKDPITSSTEQFLLSKGSAQPVARTFKYYESKPYNDRKPFIDQIAVLSTLYRHLVDYTLSDMEESSWFAVQWTPIIIDPKFMQLQSFSIIIYYRLNSTELCDHLNQFRRHSEYSHTNILQCFYKLVRNASLSANEIMKYFVLQHSLLSTPSNDSSWARLGYRDDTLTFTYPAQYFLTDQMTHPSLSRGSQFNSTISMGSKESLMQHHFFAGVSATVLSLIDAYNYFLSRLDNRHAGRAATAFHMGQVQQRSPGSDTLVLQSFYCRSNPLSPSISRYSSFQSYSSLFIRSRDAGHLMHPQRFEAFINDLESSAKALSAQKPHEDHGLTLEDATERIPVYYRVVLNAIFYRRVRAYLREQMAALEPRPAHATDMPIEIVVTRKKSKRRTPDPEGEKPQEPDNLPSGRYSSILGSLGLEHLTVCSSADHGRGTPMDPVVLLSEPPFHPDTLGCNRAFRYTTVFDSLDRETVADAILDVVSLSTGWDAIPKASTGAAHNPLLYFLTKTRCAVDGHEERRTFVVNTLARTLTHPAFKNLSHTLCDEPQEVVGYQTLPLSGLSSSRPHEAAAAPSDTSAWRRWGAERAPDQADGGAFQHPPPGMYRVCSRDATVSDSATPTSCTSTHDATCVLAYTDERSFTPVNSSDMCAHVSAVIPQEGSRATIDASHSQDPSEAVFSQVQLSNTKYISIINAKIAKEGIRDPSQLLSPQAGTPDSKEEVGDASPTIHSRAVISLSPTKSAHELKHEFLTTSQNRLKVFYHTFIKELRKGFHITSRYSDTWRASFYHNRLMYPPSSGSCSVTSSASSGSKSLPSSPLVTKAAVLAKSPLSDCSSGQHPECPDSHPLAHQSITQELPVPPLQTEGTRRLHEPMSPRRGATDVAGSRTHDRNVIASAIKYFFNDDRTRRRFDQLTLAFGDSQFSANIQDLATLILMNQVSCNFAMPTLIGALPDVQSGVTFDFLLTTLPLDLPTTLDASYRADSTVKPEDFPNILRRHREAIIAAVPEHPDMSVVTCQRSVKVEIVAAQKFTWADIRPSGAGVQSKISRSVPGDLESLITASNIKEIGPASPQAAKRSMNLARDESRERSVSNVDCGIPPFRPSSKARAPAHTFTQTPRNDDFPTC